MCYIDTRLSSVGTEARDKAVDRAQYNVLQVGMTLVASFAICWTYLTVCHMLIIMGFLKYQDREWEAAILLILVNSCVNPIIYCFRYHEFQAAVKKLFCKKNK